MIVRIGTFDVEPEQLEAVIRHFRLEAVRAFSAHEGFLGYEAFADAATGRLVGISRWLTREALESSGESARKVLNKAKELGAEIAGEPQILELAFSAAPEW